MWPIITHALKLGLVFSAIFCTLLLLTLRINPEILLKDYPPDIRDKWGPMRAHTKRQRVLVAGLFLVAGLSFVVWSLQSFPVFDTRLLTFEATCVHFAVMFGTFNILDCVVLDWSLVYWQPRFAVLAGTEGMTGYRNYWFHFRGFLIGIPIVLVGSALLAAIVSILA